MIDIRSKEFELMCFVKDASVLRGRCTFEMVSEKFGEAFLKKCLYERKIIYVDRKDGGLQWTDYGKREMNF